MRPVVVSAFNVLSSFMTVVLYVVLLVYTYHTLLCTRRRYRYFISAKQFPSYRKRSRVLNVNAWRIYSWNLVAAAVHSFSFSGTAIETMCRLFQINDVQRFTYNAHNSILYVHCTGWFIKHTRVFFFYYLFEFWFLEFRIIIYS